jgi:hypothetical protein
MARAPWSRLRELRWSQEDRQAHAERVRDAHQHLDRRVRPRRFQAVYVSRFDGGELGEPLLRQLLLDTKAPDVGSDIS